MALFGFASYADLVVNTLEFSCLLLFAINTLMWCWVLSGLRSNLQLKAWIFWIFIALLLVFISPNAFLLYFLIVGYCC